MIWSWPGRIPAGVMHGGVLSSLDVGESQDLSSLATQDHAQLFGELARWEATLPTAALWDSSPYWLGESAKQYDTWIPREEPQ